MHSYETETTSELSDLYREIDRIKSVNADLLAALQNLLEAIENDLPQVKAFHNGPVQAARDAIAKAEG